MTADDKQATIWTAGVLVAIVVVVAVVGLWLGWFDQMSAKG